MESRCSPARGIEQAAKQARQCGDCIAAANPKHDGAGCARGDAEHEDAFPAIPAVETGSTMRVTGTFQRSHRDINSSGYLWGGVSTAGGFSDSDLSEKRPQK